MLGYPFQLHPAHLHPCYHQLIIPKLKPPELRYDDTECHRRVPSRHRRVPPRHLRVPPCLWQLNVVISGLRLVISGLSLVISGLHLVMSGLWGLYIWDDKLMIPGMKMSRMKMKRVSQHSGGLREGCPKKKVPSEGSL